MSRLLAITFILGICNVCAAENILVIGDSFARYFADAHHGKAVYDELVADGDTIKIEFRNRNVSCGQPGGALAVIRDQTDCFDFEWADKVVLMAGYWDADNLTSKQLRTKYAEDIRKEWDRRKKDGAQFYWLDSWDWAQKAKREGYAADDIGHLTKDGYETMLSTIGLWRS